LVLGIIQTIVTTTNIISCWKSLGTLQWALAVSVAAHSALLAVRFVDPQRFERLFTETQLEVVLVNARTDERPTKAQALAQANLDGGGDVEKGLASSPLPPTALTSVGESLEEERRRQEALQVQQTRMVAQIRHQLAQMSAVALKAQATETEIAAREEKRRQLLQLLATIEKRIQEQNARPKKRYISPSTREVPYALYYDNLRRKIEEKGTENFPAMAGNKLYGELVMSLTVDRLGRVVHVQVERSSGNTALDRQALAIAKSAGPFGSFTQGMARNEDIVVISQFRFTRDETLETQLMKQQ
jgi:periplasmic protein TonB